VIEFSMQVPNAGAIRFAFAGLAAQVKDWRANIWPTVVKSAIRPWLTRQFAEQGQGAHGKWAPLSAKYQKQKNKKYSGQPILVRTGALRDSLLSESNQGQMTARTLAYGTSIPYALFHQTGTKRGLPARRIFDPEQSDARGTLKGLIRMSVARGVTLQARKLGFAVGGSDLDAAEAVTLGRSLISSGGQ